MMCYKFMFSITKSLGVNTSRHQSIKKLVPSGSTIEPITEFIKIRLEMFFSNPVKSS